jgi:hypothetical protein
MMNVTSNPQNAAEQASKNYRASTAQLGFNTSIPESVRATAVKAVDQSREVYDRSKAALDASVATLEGTLDATGQGAGMSTRKSGYRVPTTGS